MYAISLSPLIVLLDFNCDMCRKMYICCLCSLYNRSLMARWSYLQPRNPQYSLVFTCIYIVNGIILCFTNNAHSWLNFKTGFVFRTIIQCVLLKKGRFSKRSWLLIFSSFSCFFLCGNRLFNFQTKLIHIMLQ